MRVLDDDTTDVLRVVGEPIGPGLTDLQVQARQLRDLLKELASRLLSLAAEEHALFPLDIPATIR
jgi:hypothetical protein